MGIGANPGHIPGVTRWGRAALPSEGSAVAGGGERAGDQRSEAAGGAGGEFLLPENVKCFRQ